MRIRALDILVTTSEGPFGVRLELPVGLVVLQADNTRGKSTCLQAIAFALGMEGMLGPSRDVPLPHAVTDVLESDGTQLPVVHSVVTLEVENAAGEIVTIARTAKGERRPELITVWPGAMLTGKDANVVSRDYYVRVPGGATSESGFHRYLAGFLGWELPLVPSFSGGDVPLYPEVLFPLFYVEQKKGWAAIEGRFPTHFRVREPSRRAVEFVLALDARDLESQRANLRAQLERIRRKWKETLSLADSIAKSGGAILEGVPSQPDPTWRERVAPRVLVSVGDSWISIEEIIERLREELGEAESIAVAPVSQEVGRLSVDLRVLEEGLRAQEFAITGELTLLANERAELEGANRRLAVIDEDIGRNKDARRLQSLGGRPQLRALSGSCPTCHQSLSEPLAPLAERGEANPMSLDENIAFLQEQREIFIYAAAHASQAIDTRERRLQALRTAAAETRARVRSTKRTLTDDARLPSRAEFERRIAIASRVDVLSNVRRRVDEILSDLTPLVDEFVRYQAELQQLPSADRTQQDSSKLRLLAKSFASQLQAYSLESLPASEVTISPDSFRVVHGDFDLQFDLSASDAIRAAWAYRVALLEVAREAPTNHLGVLMLDEPRQQDASAASFRALLRRLGEANKAAQQVIVATSEPLDSLRSLMDGVPVTLMTFPDRILQPR